MWPLTERFTDALTVAVDTHEGQFRKGSETPYIAHLLGVASTVLELGGDEDAVIAALLHDALEDQSHRITADDLRRRFGDHVARIVVALSDYVGPDPANKPDWRVRKEGYLAHLRAETDPSTVRVSLADKLYNVTALRRDLERLGPSVWDRFRVGPTQQLWYHDSLVEIFREKAPGPLTEEYAQTVAALHALATEHA
jgi:(p)ppGpp synthase/HD superfamily hydrolase